MTPPTSLKSRARFVLAGFAAVAALAALGAAPAHAFFIGFPYYGPGPFYYGYPAPYYPYGYAPPAYSYYPPPPAYSYYPPAAAPAPAAMPQAPAPQASAAPTANATAGVSYTNKPPFTNSAGQTCREYKTSSSGRDVFGTACKQADGQWRVVN